LSKLAFKNKLLFLLICFAVAQHAAFAESIDAEFSIRDIRSELKEGVYHLNARLDLQLGDEMREALRNGVPLVFVLELEILEPRFKWLNREVAHVEQRYELRYHALSQQYLLTNLNTGIQSAFHNLTFALSKLSYIENLPLLDADVIEGRDDVLARLRIRLDVGKLPLPLKIRAYTSQNWYTTSTWVRWALQ